MNDLCALSLQFADAKRRLAIRFEEPSPPPHDPLDVWDLEEDNPTPESRIINVDADRSHRRWPGMQRLSAADCVIQSVFFASVLGITIYAGSTDYSSLWMTVAPVTATLLNAVVQLWRDN